MSLFSLCSEIVHKLRRDPKEEQLEEFRDIPPGQDHVFAFYDQLPSDKQRILDDEFDKINVQDIEDAFVNAWEINNLPLQGVTLHAPNDMNWDLKKPPQSNQGANLSKWTNVGPRKLQGWRSLGLDCYSRGAVAYVILAGGMDHRFGDTIPKGALDVGLLSHKSIFQLYIERVRRLQHLTQRKAKHTIHIPIYIMCNRQNQEIIEEFFHENDFFGVREQDVLFFTQGYAPVFDERGKFLLKEKYNIAMYPNGNGGIFKALVEEGMISDMKSRGVQVVFVSSVDNLLAKVGDPTLIGYHLFCKADASMKCVERLSTEDNLGVFCTKVYRPKIEDVDGDGKLDIVRKVRAAVVEYFEMPEDAKKKRIKIGAGSMPLELSAGNISQYVFKLEFCMQVSKQMNKRWHMIPKAFPYISLTTGKKVHPERGKRNAYRLETFIFDAFDHTHKIVGLQVPRTELALVKNITGPDSPQTALQALGKLHQSWILEAGGMFEATKLAGDREDAKCEISPLVSYDGEDLIGQFVQPIALPFYLPSQMEMTQFSAASSQQTRRPSSHYLDWYSNLAQKELEAELQGNLGGVMNALEDTNRHKYEGERASGKEELPPTPRLGMLDKRLNSKGQNEDALALAAKMKALAEGKADDSENKAKHDNQDGDGRKEDEEEAEPSDKGTGRGEVLISLDDSPKKRGTARGQKTRGASSSSKRKEYWGEPDTTNNA